MELVFIYLTVAMLSFLIATTLLIRGYGGDVLPLLAAFFCVLSSATTTLAINEAIDQFVERSKSHNE